MADQQPQPQGIVNGPFSSVLAEPAYQGAAAQGVRPSGYGGAGESIAMFADKFLSGLSQGRARAYQASEQKNVQTQSAIHRAIQDVANSNLPDATKQQQMSKLQGMLGNMIYHAIPGEEGGKKKKSSSTTQNPGGVAGGDAGGGMDPDHPGHQILGVMKKVVGNLIGPGAQKQAYTQDEIQGTLGQVYNFLGDPKNSVQAQVAQADQGLMNTYSKIREGNQGKDPTLSQLMQNPDFLKQYTATMSVTGKPTPGIQLIMDSANEQTRLHDPAYLANIEREKAMTGYYNERSTSQATFKTKDGKMVVRQPDGSFTDQSGIQIPSESPLLQGLTPFNQKTAAPGKVTLKADEHGNLMKIDGQGNMLGMVEHNGKPVNVGSPLARTLMTENFVDERNLSDRMVQIQEAYDARKLAIEKDKNLTKAQKEQMLGEIEQDRNKAVETKRHPNAAPPSRKNKGEAPKSKDDQVFGSFLDSMFGGGGSATSGGAPQKSQGSAWANQ